MKRNVLCTFLVGSLLAQCWLGAALCAAAEPDEPPHADVPPPTISPARQDPDDNKDETQKKVEFATPGGKEAGPKMLPWPESLAEGKRRARADGRPLLVRVGADWCPWCEKLAAQIEDPAAQEELRRWTLTYVDADQSPAEARQLGIGPIPALRVLDSSGKVVAAHDGYLPREKLLAWLKENYERSQGSAPEVLTADTPPDEKDVEQLIAMLQNPSPVEREASIRRLLPHAPRAAVAVAQAFANGKLSTRLATLELLAEWRAPVAGLDPWRPETLTAERQKALEEWAAQAKEARPAAAELSPEQLEAAGEQIARLAQVSDEESEAMIERLSRLGPALRPQVAERLKEAAVDRTRERLHMLRYRLVASDSLALKWRGGLARLAASDTSARHKAAAELVQRVSAADEALLLELFSDPDALVREISLRGLQGIGQDASSGALIKLLDDPEPNVRAAVLKQLTDQPAAELVPRIAKYAAREKDPDLVVHAIRFLKAADATKSLMGLVHHESWQVRAEAVGSLAESVTGHNQSKATADVYAALIEALDDSDGFVVSRALHGLQNVDLLSAVEPLTKVVLQHPDLATEAIEALTHTPAMRSKAEPFLRKLVASEDPVLRAPAISAFGKSNADDLDRLFTLGLQDSASQVRLATARTLFELAETAMTEKDAELTTSADATVFPTFSSQVSAPQPGFFESIIRALLPGAGTPAKPAAEPEEMPAEPAEEVEEKAAKPAEEATGNTESDEQAADKDEGAREAWLQGYRDGQGRPKWMSATIAPLEKMLQAPSASERSAAALALIALGKDTPALSVLTDLLKTDRAQREAASRALPWLPWPQRLEFFNLQAAQTTDISELRLIIHNMTKSKDLRAAEPLWKLLEREGVDVSLADAVYQALNTLYRIDVAMYGGPEHKVRKPTIESLKQYAQQGNPWQKNVALALLIGAKDEQAGELAQKIFDDLQTAADFRVDAFQLLLLANDEDEGQRIAVGQIGSQDERIRKMALMYLARGPDGQLRGQMRVMSRSDLNAYGSRDNADVAPPKGLTEEMVRPLLAAPDLETTACAGYLMATLGHAEGLDPLVRIWRQEHQAKTWGVPLYKAIAVLDDDKQTPILNEISKKLDPGEHRHFYWTIRSMEGPEVLKLRKKIRDEVGMDNLR